MRTLCLSIALLLPALALAVPMELNHTGRLLDVTGLPLDAPHDVDVAIYASPTSSSPLWSETLYGVGFDNGYFLSS